MTSRLANLGILAVLCLPVTTEAEPVHCTCRDGNACYHFLGAPVDPPDDPCNCPQCGAEPKSCPKILPEGWNPACAGNNRMECFLRRHAASWRLACSRQLAGTCDCKTPHPELCPMCGEKGSAWNAEGLEIGRRQLGIETRILGDPRGFIVIKSPHFYLVTDIRQLKIHTQAGSFRKNAFTWKSDLVPADSGNVEGAVRRMEAEEPKPAPPPRPGGIDLLGRGAMVGRRGPDGNWSYGAREDKSYRFEDVLPGPSSLRTRKEGFEGEWVSATLASGDHREVHLVRPEGARLEVEVRSEESEEPFPGARVALEGWCGHATTGRDGRVALGPGRPGLGPLTIDPWIPRDATYVLPAE